MDNRRPCCSREVGPELQWCLSNVPILLYEKVVAVGVSGLGPDTTLRCVYRIPGMVMPTDGANGVSGTPAGGRWGTWPQLHCYMVCFRKITAGRPGE